MSIPTESGHPFRRKADALMLVWQEYRAVHPDGYQHRQFCSLSRQWIDSVIL
jgi:transposase